MFEAPTTTPDTLEKAPPSLIELDANRGREIEGIPVKTERFKNLEIGPDIEIVESNPYLTLPVDAMPPFCFISPSVGETDYQVEPPHWRSVSTGQMEVVWSNTSKQPFFDVDVKGVGYLKPSARDINFEKYNSWHIPDVIGDQGREKVLGLSSKSEFFEKDGTLLEKSNFFLSEGLRTEAYSTIGKILRLPFQGEMYTVAELKKKGVLPNRRNWQPYQAVRSLKMRNRVEEFVKAPDRALDLFSKAINARNKEKAFFGQGSPLDSINRSDQETFFNEFAENLGSNLAVLINLGYSHYRMHSSNITLAAEVVDVGTLSPWNSENDPDFTTMYQGLNRGSIKDIRDLVTDLRMLTGAAKGYGLSTSSGEEIAQRFISGFIAKALPDLIEKNGNSIEGAKFWIDRITKKILMDGSSLPGLLNHEVEEWNI